MRAVVRQFKVGVGTVGLWVERECAESQNTKDLGRGTGLGLSVVHSIVSDHGGAIEVSSTPGQGSSFTVYLPRSEEAASAIGMERAPIPSGRGETVLLVDDDEALVRLGEEMIAALGYESIGFQDSQAALEALRTEVPK